MIEIRWTCCRIWTSRAKSIAGRHWVTKAFLRFAHQMKRKRFLPIQTQSTNKNDERWSFFCCCRNWKIKLPLSVSGGPVMDIPAKRIRPEWTEEGPPCSRIFPSFLAITNKAFHYGSWRAVSHAERGRWSFVLLLAAHIPDCRPLSVCIGGVRKLPSVSLFQ